MKTHLIPLAIIGLAVPLVVSWGTSRFSPGGKHETAQRFERGEDVFKHQCAGCHSLEASQRRLGPPLGEIGRIAATRKPGMSAAEYIAEAIAMPGAFRAPGTTGGMPQGLVLKQDELRSLVGFLMTHGGEISDAELSTLKVRTLEPAAAETKEIDWAQVEQGEAIFRGKGQCIACHLLRDDPSLTLRGPSLLSAASLSEAELRASINAPSATIAPGYQQVVVECQDGRIVQGRLVEATDAGLWLLTTSSAGQLASVFIANSEIEISRGERFTISPVSLMPDMRDLSRDEVDCLVAFLKNRHGGQDK